MFSCSIGMDVREDLGATETLVMAKFQGIKLMHLDLSLADYRCAMASMLWISSESA